MSHLTPAQTTSSAVSPGVYTARPTCTPSPRLLQLPFQLEFIQNLRLPEGARGKAVISVDVGTPGPFVCGVMSQLKGSPKGEDYLSFVNAALGKKTQKTPTTTQHKCFMASSVRPGWNVQLGGCLYLWNSLEHLLRVSNSCYVEALGIGRS